MKLDWALKKYDIQTEKNVFLSNLYNTIIFWITIALRMIFAVSFGKRIKPRIKLAFDMCYEQ